MLVNAINAASWNGAGAESVSLMWIFLIAEAMLAAAQAQPSLQPSQSRQLICEVSSNKSQKVAISIVGCVTTNCAANSELCSPVTL